MVGKSVGAGKIQRAYQDALRFTILVPLISFVVGWIIIFLRAPLVSVFNLRGNISETVLLTAQSLLIVYSLEIPVKVVLCLRHFRRNKWLLPVTPEGKAGLELWRAERN